MFAQIKQLRCSQTNHGSYSFEDEQKNEENNIPSSWKFKVGRCWLYGQYIIISPCGYILWNEAIWRMEGCKNTMDIWNSCYRGIPPERRPNYIWTDSGCKLWPYINNNEYLSALWEFTRWLIDRAHALIAHNNTGRNSAQVRFCREHCDTTRMAVADKPPGVHERGNSEKQEQFMNVIGAFSWTFNMHFDIQWMFLYLLCMDMNELLLQKMQTNNQQCIPGPSAYI